MKILLTGAAGFIGSNLSERLLKEGHTVYGMDNFISGNIRNIKKFRENERFIFIEKDVSKAFEFNDDLDWIMHFASPASPPKYQKYPIETLRVNSEGTYNLLELAKERKASFFLASTSEVYGDPMIHPQPEQYWGNVNPNGLRSCYDEAKRYSEAITLSMHREYGLPVRIIRIFNTYGPNMDIDDGRVVTNFIKQILKDMPVTIYGNGKQTRSFQYVDDLVEGIIRLMHTDYSSPVNLGNPEEFNMIELAELLADIKGYRPKLNYHALPADDPKRRKPDITLAKEIMGWEPVIEVRDGLKRTLDYFEKMVV